MLDLKKFSSCPVTLFKKYCDKGIHLNMLKQLVNDGNAKVFSVYENEKTATYLHSYFQLSYPEIKTTHRHSSEEFDICFTNFEETKNILLENINNTNVEIYKNESSELKSTINSVNIKDFTTFEIGKDFNGHLDNFSGFKTALITLDKV